MLHVNQIIITISHLQTQIHAVEQTFLFHFCSHFLHFQIQMAHGNRHEKPLLDWWKADKIHFYLFSTLRFA